MNNAIEVVANLCRGYAGMLWLPPGVDDGQLMWAISGNESSFGANCAPRHEPAFDKGGIYGNSAIMNPLLAKFGSAAACSYGPWQMMFCNAPDGTTPDAFNDIAVAFRLSAGFLNQRLAKYRPSSLADVGEIWNGGHPMMTPSAQVASYVQRLSQNYAVPIP